MREERYNMIHMNAQLLNPLLLGYLPRPEPQQQAPDATTQIYMPSLEFFFGIICTYGDRVLLKRLTVYLILYVASLLTQVKRRYRIAPTPIFSEKRRNSSMFPFEGRQRISPRFDKDEGTMLMRTQIDLELARMRTMTSQEAAAAAARAVAEAEAAIAEAEEAAREAEAAEADAEAAQAFADAAMRTLKGRNHAKMVKSA